MSVSEIRVMAQREMSPGFRFAPSGLLAVRRRSVPKDEALAAMGAPLAPFDLLVAIEDLRSRALEIAIDSGLTIYDCFYIALAEREDAPLITADERSLRRRGRRRLRCEGCRAE
jgi:predicted nucleic acid-binding protein